MRVRPLGRGLVLTAALSASFGAQATNGYFAIGYGARNVAMGGTGVAFPQSTLAAAHNPAGLSAVGDGFDAGIRFFSPIRDGSLDCSGLNPFAGFGSPGCSRAVADDSERELFGIPNFGYSKRLSSTTTIGIAAYGNGGLNTSYEGTNIFDESFAAFFGAPAGTNFSAIAPGLFGPNLQIPNAGDKLGVDLSQLIIAPTVSYQFNTNHAFGVSALVGIQRFSARGLGDFAFFSNDPASLTNRGNDWSAGLGVRVGWRGKVSPTLTLGATAASKIYMTEFEKYSGLFADNGDFDIPANFALGLAFAATPKLTLAFDVQRILYEGVDSISNPGPTAAEFQGRLFNTFSAIGALPPGFPVPPDMAADRFLGAKNGLGFGWENIWVVKLGASYKLSSQWTVRAGFNYGESPIPDDQILFNILAPGVVEKHITIGASYAPDQHSEWTVAYMHAIDETQRGVTPFFGAVGEISMHQNSLEVAYTRRF